MVQWIRGKKHIITSFYRHFNVTFWIILSYSMASVWKPRPFFERYTPKENHMEPKNHPIWKGKSSEPNHHDFRFKLLIFQGVLFFFKMAVDLFFFLLRWPRWQGTFHRRPTLPAVRLADVFGKSIGPQKVMFGWGYCWLFQEGICVYKNV